MTSTRAETGQYTDVRVTRIQGEPPEVVAGTFLRDRFRYRFKLSLDETGAETDFLLRIWIPAGPGHRKYWRRERGQEVTREAREVVGPAVTRALALWDGGADWPTQAWPVGGPPGWCVMMVTASGRRYTYARHDLDRETADRLCRRVLAAEEFNETHWEGV